jgi:hypothetical protein
MMDQPSNNSKRTKIERIKAMISGPPWITGVKIIGEDGSILVNRLGWDGRAEIGREDEEGNIHPI